MNALVFPEDKCPQFYGHTPNSSLKANSTAHWALIVDGTHTTPEGALLEEDAWQE